jgi:hypothetical protein
MKQELKAGRVMSPHNDERYTALLRRVMANARAIITCEVGLPLGCTRMSRLFYWLKPRRDFEFPVFEEYLNAVREFAIGQDRLEWNREALFQQDVKLEEVNAAFRDRVHKSCHDIVEQLSVETSPT